MKEVACEIGAESELPLQQQQRKKRAKKGDNVKLVSMRIRQILDAKSQLEDIETCNSTSAERRSGAYRRRIDVKKVENVITPYSFMFRSSLNLEVPFHASKNESWRSLQEEARTALSSRVQDSSSWNVLEKGGKLTQSECALL